MFKVFVISNQSNDEYSYLLIPRYCVCVNDIAKLLSPNRGLGGFGDFEQDRTWGLRGVNMFLNIFLSL